jgi:hypothetical protein
MSSRAWFDALCLGAHPFFPDRDPRRNFDFQKNNVSLRGPLMMFEHPELAEYYVRVGGFERASDEADRALDARRYPTRGLQPPAILVQGGSAVGRSSFAEYLAHIIRRRWEAAAPAVKPGCRRIKINGENIAKLLWVIKTYVKNHADSNAIAGAKEAFEMWAADGGVTTPDENVIESLFAELAPSMRAAPPLILIIRDITFQRRAWMARLASPLTAMNVVPIFISDHPNVYTLTRANDPDFISLQLRTLLPQDGEAFVRARVRSFRVPCLHQHDDTYPFDAAAVRATCASLPGGMGVRLLVELMSSSLDQLVDALEAKRQQDPAFQPTPADLVVNANHITAGYRHALSPSPANNGTAGGRQ